MTARLRLLLLTGLLLALAFAGSLLWTRGIALQEVTKAETAVHQREQARLWHSLIDQQQVLLELAADDLLSDTWLARVISSGNQDLLTSRLQEALPRLEARYGVTGLEITDAQEQVLFPPIPRTQRVPQEISAAETASSSREAVIGFRQNLNRDFVLSYSLPLPEGGRLMLTTTMDRPLQGISRNGVAPARPAAVADLRGQAVAFSGPEEGQALLQAILAGEAAVPAELRVLETPLSDIAGRPIGQVVSLLPAEAVSSTLERLNLITLLLAIALFILLLVVLARAIRAEFTPLEQLIGGVAALAGGQSEVEVPRHPGDDEAGRLSTALQQLRQRALLLTTLEISRERQRRRQERFLRRQLTGLAETLEGKDREALLKDLDRLEQAARREAPQESSNGLAAADGRLEQALLEPRAAGQDDFALLAVAFENLSFRIRDQNANLKQLVAELNEALRAKNEFILLQQELDLARKMQLSILPPDRPEQAGVAVHGMMLPAKEVGGDFYDVFELPDGRLALVVADVSGKGVPAAFFSLITRTLLKAIATAGAEP
ncbi:MAG TPA: SpoIIE family protein phosphatase, partial [Kiloniellales bacterium]|nr:SpoIIE family protein phosphatase [Kiloniellales bacterium]